MTRFLPQLTTLADDVAWHLEGFAQGLLDVLTVTVLALAVYVSGVEGGPAALEPAPAMTHASNICVVDCISAMVLQPQDS